MIHNLLLMCDLLQKKHYFLKSEILDNNSSCRKFPFHSRIKTGLITQEKKDYDMLQHNQTYNSSCLYHTPSMSSSMYEFEGELYHYLPYMAFDIPRSVLECAQV